MDSTEDIFLVSAFLAGFVVGLAANVAICITIYRKICLKKPMNALILNLAVSDMIVLLSASPQFAFRHFFTHPTGSAGDWICVFLTDSIFLWIAGAASAFTLVLIAFERYYAVLHPFKPGKRMTWTKLKISLLCCWAYATIYGGIEGISSKFNEEVNICDETWPSVHGGKIYSISTLVFDILLPLGIISILYCRVVLHLWKPDQNNVISSSQLAVVKSRKKVTRLALAVTITYGICWIPSILLYILANFTDKIQFSSFGYRISQMLVCLNAVVDPFLYCLHSQGFLDYWKGILGFKKRRGAMDVRQPNIGSHVTHQVQDLRATFDISEPDAKVQNN